MAQSLKENISHKEQLVVQLQELNKTLEDRIQQRTTQIEAINKDLREAMRHKSQFLANVNHELRTPVSAIISSAHLIIRKTEGQIPSQQTDNLLGLVHTAEHLLSLINGLLDLSKIEAGRIELRVEPVKIDELIHTAASTVEPMLQHDRVQLTRDITPGIPVFSTDGEKLRQIVFNLLGNAAKFTQEGEIKIAASRLNGSLRLAVSDTGRGIADRGVAAYLRRVPPRKSVQTWRRRSWFGDCEETGGSPRGRSPRGKRGWQGIDFYSDAADR